MARKGSNFKINEGIVLKMSDMLKGLDRTKPVEREFVNVLPNGDSITTKLKLNGFEMWLHVTHEKESVELSFDYCVLIEGIESNLGSDKGDNLFFVCPVSGQRCKDLYLFGDCSQFKHRTAYKQQVYYPSQYFSKNDRLLYSIQCLEQSLIPSLRHNIQKSHYLEEDTHLIQRVANLENRLVKKQIKRIHNINEQYKKDLQRISCKVSGEIAAA